MIKPLADRVIIKMLEQELTSKGGIILQKGQTKFKLAEVVAVGRGMTSSDGIIAPEVKVGDIVYVTSNTGDEITDGNETYHVVTERTIVAVADRAEKTKKEKKDKVLCEEEK